MCEQKKTKATNTTLEITAIIIRLLRDDERGSSKDASFCQECQVEKFSFRS